MLLPNLPKPVLFHPLKHHLGYIKSFVQKIILVPNPAFKAAILSIGNASQLDVYIGALSERQISEEVILYLQERDLLAPEVYRHYLTAEGTAYRLLTLSDSTDWVLRWGVAAGRHVHLHPARYAAHTIRVKANVLKTAIAAVITAGGQREKVGIRMVNQVRAQWLALPPVKSISEEAGAARLIELLLN